MPDLPSDDALEEIWAARRRAWQMAGGTWESYAEHLRQLDAQFEREGGTLIRRPLAPPTEADGSAILREEPPQ